MRKVQVHPVYAHFCHFFILMRKLLGKLLEASYEVRCLFRVKASIPRIQMPLHPYLNQSCAYTIISRSRVKVEIDIPLLKLLYFLGINKRQSVPWRYDFDTKIFSVSSIFILCKRQRPTIFWREFQREKFDSNLSFGTKEGNRSTELFSRELSLARKFALRGNRLRLSRGGGKGNEKKNDEITLTFKNRLLFNSRSNREKGALGEKMFNIFAGILW